MQCFLPQVWILAYSVDDAKGVICRRDGITESDPQGKQWNEGAGVCSKFFPNLFFLIHCFFPAGLKLENTRYQDR